MWAALLLPPLLPRGRSLVGDDEMRGGILENVMETLAEGNLPVSGVYETNQEGETCVVFKADTQEFWQRAAPELGGGITDRGRSLS